MKIRKLIATVLMIATLVAASVVPVAASPRVLTVGYPLIYGFFEKNEQGEYQGLVYDYLMEIAKYTGWEYKFVEGTPKEIYDKFANGEIDLLGSIAYNDAVSEIALFPEYNCGYVNTVLKVRADNNEISDIEYVRQNKPEIGVWMDSKRLYSHFKQFADSSEIEYTPKWYPTLESLSRALENGEVDIILTDDTNKTTIGHRSIAKFSAMPHYIVTPKGNSDILRELNMALRNITSVDDDFSRKLTEKHFANINSDRFVLSQSEREYIAQKKVHTIVTNPNARPIQYFSDEGEYKGIAADLLNYIARETGLIFTYKQTKNVWQSLDEIKAGRADILASVNVKSDTAEKNNLVNSAPFLPLNVGIIKRKDSNESKNSKVAISPPLEYMANEIDCEVVTFETAEQCIQGVEDGEFDYTYASSYVAEYLTQKNHYQNITFVPLTERDNTIAIGIAQPVDPVLLTIINKAITAIPAEEIQSIVLANTLIMDTKVSLKSFILTNPLTSILILGAFFLVLSVLVIMIIVSRTKSNRKMYSMANIDEITGAMTFSRFKKQAALIIKNSPLQHALISFDINKFKIINDLFGHKRGDEVLSKISDIISNSLGDEEIFARISADNFNILTEYRNDGGIISRISEITKKIETCFEGYHIDTVFGIYRVPKGDIDEIVTMSDCANLAKLSIKDKPGSQYAFYDEAVRSEILREKEIENLMEEALTTAEFKLYLQPKYSFKDGTIAGAEALVRWDNHEKGMIYPNDFIPLFEKNGFIQRLDLYMFEKVCRFLIELNAEVIPTVSVNFSRVHLNNLNLANELSAIAKRVGISPSHIEVELTETAIFDNEERMIRVMTDLKKAGFSLSIDDFGSGYSSLSALKNLPADVIKFDRGFLLESSDSQRGKDIIKYLVRMSRSLNLVTVAEGVETKQQVDFLTEVGCDIAQGYYYAKPMPADEFATLYTSTAST